MADYQIPSKNSAFTAYNMSRNIDTMKSLLQEKEEVGFQGKEEVGLQIGSSLSKVLSDLNKNFCESLAVQVPLEKMDQLKHGEAEEKPLVVQNKRNCSSLKIEDCDSRSTVNQKKLRLLLKEKNVECSSLMPVSSSGQEQSSRLTNAISNGEPSQIKSPSKRESSSPSIENQASSSNNGITIAYPNQRKLLFEKVLWTSDVGDYNRVVIYRRFAEAHFPPLKIGKDTFKKEVLTFSDDDNVTWEMKFEYWKKSQSYVLTKGWKAFVAKHKLQCDDIICFYELEPKLQNKHFGISYHRRPVVETKTIRLFGVDIAANCGNGNEIAANGSNGNEGN